VSVERYHSVEEMPAPKAVSGKELYQRVAEVWHTARVLARRRYPHAVLRFHSIDEARAAREPWERENQPGREG